MSGRSSGGAGWDRPRTPAWVYALVGVLLTLVVVLAIVIVMLLGNGGGGLASATSTPTAAAGGATPTTAASVAGGQSPAPSVAATAAPTSAGTPAPTAPPSTAPTPHATGTPAPSGSPKPAITAFQGPHTADCNANNGTATLGYIHLSWTATNVSGVRLAIDTPDAATGYANPYGDYAATFATDVPYSCDFTLSDSTGPYHEYMVITDHTTGYWQYRYIKVYQSPKPTATP